VGAKALVHEFGMGVDVHGRDSTKAACRAVSDAIRHSSLPMMREYLAGDDRILIDVTIGVPNAGTVDVEHVQRELPFGEVTVLAVEGGVAVPGADTIMACAAVTVSVDRAPKG
jgi:uncharacterized protein (TIGR02058 family)